MAEVALLRDRLNQTPVLLLDDVMSELDEQRRTQLIKVISQDIQTFITSTNLSYFDDEFLSNAEIIELTQEGSTNFLMNKRSARSSIARSSKCMLSLRLVLMSSFSNTSIRSI